MNPEFWRDRPVLVTGAAGFLGLHLTSELWSGGADVTALVRDETREGQALRYCSGRVVRGDVRNQAVMERILGENEIDTVFHLAAQVIVPIAGRNPVSTFESNIEGTWSILEACRRSYLVKQIVVASTDKVYGEVGEKPYTEDMPLLGIHPYDVSKVCADLLAQSYAKTYNMKIGITRSGNYYGPGDTNWSRIIPGTIRSILKGMNPVIRSDGNGVRDYFYILDGAEANILLAEKLEGWLCGEPHIFNFSNSEPISTLGLVNKILFLMDEQQLAPVVLGTATGEIEKQFLDSTKARVELGWRPRVALNEGLLQTIDYYKYKEILDESSRRE
jgi:CDP-glucose 4,6-dehydratase